MNVTVLFFVMRNKTTNQVIDAQAVTDMYSEVQANYPVDLIPSIDTLKTALKGYGELTKKEAYYQFINGNDVVLSAEAKDLPNIGNVVVLLEERAVSIV